MFFILCSTFQHYDWNQLNTFWSLMGLGITCRCPLKSSLFILIQEEYHYYIEYHYIDLFKWLLPLQQKLPKTILIPYESCFHNSQYRFCFDIRNRLLNFLSKLHLFWSYGRISIKWTSLVQKSVRVIEMPAL